MRRSHRTRRTYTTVLFISSQTYGFNLQQPVGFGVNEEGGGSPSRLRSSWRPKALDDPFREIVNKTSTIERSEHSYRIMEIDSFSCLKVINLILIINNSIHGVSKLTTQLPISGIS